MRVVLHFGSDLALEKVENSRESRVFTGAVQGTDTFFLLSLAMAVYTISTYSLLKSQVSWDLSRQVQGKRTPVIVIF